MSSDPGPGTALVVRRAITIEASPERVWRELESEEAMREWFLPDMDYEPRVGGWIELRGDKGGAVRFGGRVLVVDPPHELTFEWDRLAPAAWPAPTLVTIRLTPHGDGTVVEILHHGFEALGEGAEATYRSFEGGWDDAGLRRLRDRVAA